jgi:hypothetical protein
LTQFTSEEGWQYLRNIPDVGPKTAACVLMFNLNLPVMPVEGGCFVHLGMEVSELLTLDNGLALATIDMARIVKKGCAGKGSLLAPRKQASQRLDTG